MRHYRLWEGLRQYGWVARGLVVIGLLISLYTISEAIDWFQNHRSAPLYAFAVGQDSLAVNLARELWESISDGGLNLVTLVLLEVVTYHFMRRTLRIILDKEVKDAHTFRPFFDAQLRMIKVSSLAYLFQVVALALLRLFLPDFLEDRVGLLVEAAVLGYAMADNYCEQFDLTVRQSFTYLRKHHLAVCLGLGLPLYVMLQVPLLGTILGPLVTAVTAGIVLRELGDLHVVTRLRPAAAAPGGSA